MPKVVPQVLPSCSELYSDSPGLAPGPLSALAPICAHSPHFIFFGILFVAELSLGVRC